jgi:hypothetical protein
MNSTARGLCFPGRPLANRSLRGRVASPSGRKADVAGDEVRPESEPEPEVAEIDTLQQEVGIRLFARRHESPEQTFERRGRGRMVLR